MRNLRTTLPLSPFPLPPLLVFSSWLPVPLFNTSPPLLPKFLPPLGGDSPTVLQGSLGIKHKNPLIQFSFIQSLDLVWKPFFRKKTLMVERDALRPADGR